MLIQDLNRIVSRINITPGQIMYCTTNCSDLIWHPIYLMFKENFPLDTQTAWAIEMTADREEWPELPMGATTETRTRWGTPTTEARILGVTLLIPRWLWEASSLVFQSSFSSRAWDLEEVLASIPRWTTLWEMVSEFCPTLSGVLFCSVVLGFRYTQYTTGPCSQ